MPEAGDIRSARTVRRAAPGRRTTLAVACVLAVVGGPVTAGAAYAGPAPSYPAWTPATPRPATAEPRTDPESRPTPEPSPGVRPEPVGEGPQDDGGTDGRKEIRPGADTGSGADGGGAGDDHWSTTAPPTASGDRNDGDQGAPREGKAADGAPKTLKEVRAQLASLHDRAGSATDAYNAAEAKAAAQRDKIDSLERRAASTRKELGKLKKRAGALARAQYRSGGVPATARLLLSDDPASFLRDAGLARRGQKAAQSLVSSLTETRERLADYTKDAKERYARLEESLKRKEAARKRIRKQLEKAEKLESGLAEQQRERLRELERQAAYARQLRWLRTGVLEEIDGRASAQGKQAIVYATAQIGKDYEWGAEGPETYDCSGLTMRAWEAAGVSIPRTSQEQWRRLPRVDVTDMRPGDLIIYKDDASHVGMYLGDGVMVHAPRTGRQITVEGAGSYPILGVVRPDK